MNQNDEPRTLRGRRPVSFRGFAEGANVAQDRPDPESLPIDPSLLSLPSGYETTGDPVDGNPFPVGSVHFRLWHEATRQAEEAIARLKASWLAADQAFLRSIPRTIDEMTAGSELLKTQERERLATEFEVWAARGAQSVLTDDDVRSMDEWLVGYANACLETRARHMQKHRLARHLAEAQLRLMRDALGSLVFHWKAEIRRYRTIREDEAREADQARTDSPPLHGSLGEHPLSAREARSNASFPKRAAWFREELDKRGWSVHDLEAHNGPNWKTGRRISEGRWVKETVLGKLARVFSEKARVNRMDIPDD